MKSKSKKIKLNLKMAMQKKFPQLQYRIVYCSSEEEEHQVTELLKQGSNCKGWESARFCEFPQIISYNSWEL